MYDAGGNIMQLLRQTERPLLATEPALAVAYDLQAGSYNRTLLDPIWLKKRTEYAKALGDVLAPIVESAEIVDAGVGEATTLAFLLDAIRPSSVRAFDISLSRLFFARQLLDQQSKDSVQLAVGELGHFPFPDNSCDVVMTSHAVEPNRGSELAILAEMRRVARQHVVLFEPAYELASSEARARMDLHGYCRDLPGAAQQAGMKIMAHRLLGISLNPLNPTAVTICSVDKASESSAMERGAFACPWCAGPLELKRHHQWCSTCLRVYPVLDGIPLLTRQHGVLACRWLDGDL